MVNLLPDWARWIWFGIFSFIVVVHATHPFRSHGVQRLWHSGHLLMAVGMAWMFLPLEYGNAFQWAWRLLFAAMAGLAGGYGVLKLVGGTRIDLPWIVLAIDSGAMAYMWTMMDGAASAAVSYALATCCIAEAVGWFSTELPGGRGHPWLPRAIGWSGRGEAPYLAGSEPLAYRTTRIGATALGVMAVGMAHMLVGMQLML
jgi:hypothetical protein